MLNITNVSHGMFLWYACNHQNRTNVLIFQPWSNSEASSRPCASWIMFPSKTFIPQRKHYIMAISIVNVSLVPTAMTFKAKTHHAIHTRKNHHHSLWIPLIRKKMNSDSLFLTTAVSWNRRRIPRSPTASTTLGWRLASILLGAIFYLSLTCNKPN